MEKRENKPGSRWGSRLIVFLAMAALGVPLAGATKDKKRAAAAGPATQELVWPLPPDPPRMRWEGQVQDLDNISGEKKKKSWMERMAGVKQAEEKRFRFQRPYGIVVDARGRIFVADSAARVVYVIDRSGRRVEARGGSSRAPLALPVGLALDRDERLFVSDSFLHSVLCFDPQGQVVAQFGREKLERAAGLALDRERRRLYVADAKAHRIAVFNPDSYAFERYIGGPSTGARESGKFLAPTNVAVDHKGSLYVTDTWNHRVQIFDAAGKFVRAFGTHGVRPGQFVRPKGIAIDSEGHIYVADAEFNNFQIFSPEGRPLLAVGSLGNQPGQFLLIAGLFIDAEDRIYTTEQEDARVQIFKYLPQSDSDAGKGVVKAAR